MFDREIVMDSLQKIRKAIETIQERSSVVTVPDELLCSAEGMMRLDAICMNLITLGEAVKGLEKQTRGQLLPRYPEVYWSGVMRMRDKIAHHYFEIDTDIVFLTVQQDIPKMKEIIEKMIADISKETCDFSPSEG